MELELEEDIVVAEKNSNNNNSKKRCQHGRNKYICKDCGGSALCVHGRQKNNCKECGGSNICDHGKQKQYCKKCGGSSMCNHGRQKRNCKECGGSSLCEHEKIKRTCKECGGSSICNHGKQRRMCNACGGSSMCPHGRLKYICKECGGSSICVHERQKYNCKECGGNGICNHGNQKQYCRKCAGSRICRHEKEKRRCKLCDGSGLCKSSWCETSKNRKYEGYCMPCFVNNPENRDKPAMRNYKTKEKDVVDRIRETFSEFTWVADKRIQDGCSKRRPDLLLDMGSHVIIVEIDENQHSTYDCSCENKRVMELSQDVNHRPIVFIRFNPDQYTTTDGIIVHSCWKVNTMGVMQVSKRKQAEWNQRIHVLKEQIQHWIDFPPQRMIERIELFYS